MTVQIVCSFYPKLLFFHSSVQIIIYINMKDIQWIPLWNSARYVCMTHVPQWYSYWSWIQDVIDCSTFKYVARTSLVISFNSQGYILVRSSSLLAFTCLVICFLTNMITILSLSCIPVSPVSPKITVSVMWSRFLYLFQTRIFGTIGFYWQERDQLAHY